ncbi:hypothetical protein ACHAXT_003856 [Thalassiosira profunda]
MPLLSPSGEPSEDPHALLGLERGASDDDVAKAFKKLMLKLHPDKQPVDQSEEDAAAVADELHKVMEAKAFLLEGEYLAARRAYDAKIKREEERRRQAELHAAAAAAAAAAAPPAATTQAPTPTNTAADPPQAAPATAGTTPKKSDKHKSESSEATKPGGKPAKSDPKEKPSSYAKKNVTVKQWGKQYRPTKGSAAKKEPEKSTSTRRSSDGGKSEKADKAGSNKTAARSKLNRFNDSCGDCSTTDDASATSEDDRKKHSYANAATGNRHRIPTSNRPKVPRQARNKVHSTTGTTGYRPADAPRSADFSTFQPALDQLEKQYHCPLTGKIMAEPMSDFEGNSYEREAILEYLKTHSASPVTGNPLFSMHLTPNTALREKIRYTLKLKDCLESLKNQIPAQPQPVRQQQHKYKTLREAVDHFIKDLNSGAPNIRIEQADPSGTALFSYLGLNFTLDVPGGKENKNADGILVQTWFDHGKKCAGISGRVVGYNAALQQMGLGECRLTFRKANAKHAFTLTQKMSAEGFSKTKLCHAIEYFVEMTIKLHNVINTSDAKKAGKVRLTSAEHI